MTNEQYAYILTVDEKYWNRLCQHNQAGFGTHVFVRKSRVAPKKAQQLLFYVTKKSQVLGVADFVERLTGGYEALWQQFGVESCFESFEEYRGFVEGRGLVTFIRFSNLKEIADPVPKAELAKILGSLNSFRLGRYLEKETALQLV
jgi:hypothetical protein